jgi:hypothetical protein
LRYPRHGTRCRSVGVEPLCLTPATTPPQSITIPGSAYAGHHRLLVGPLRIHGLRRAWQFSRWWSLPPLSKGVGPALASSKSTRELREPTKQDPCSGTVYQPLHPKVEVCSRDESHRIRDKHQAATDADIFSGSLQAPQRLVRDSNGASQPAKTFCDPRSGRDECGNCDEAYGDIAHKRLERLWNYVVGSIATDAQQDRPGRFLEIGWVDR